MAEEEHTQGRRQQTRRELARRSDVWEHFILFTDEHGNKKARCKDCGKVLNASQGTSSPKKHVSICPGQGAAAGVSEPPPCDPPRPAESSHRQPIPQNEADDHEPGLNHKEASRDLARMIALHGYDPSVVEDDYFKSFVRSLNPQFEVPSREAIEDMCSDIFKDSCRDWYLSNEEDPGKVSFAVGEAKTIQTGQVVYITAHFIDHHWNLQRVVDEVYMVLPVGDDHYHVPLPRVYVISHDVLVRRIAEDIAYLPQPPFNGLFMIVGEMTGHINHLKLKDCVEKKALETKICSATCMDHVLHSIAGCLLPDSFFAQSMLDEFNVQPDTYQELLTQHGLAKLGLLDDPWEYGESWYSCYCCLEILAQAAPPECTEQLLCTIWREIYHAIKTVSDSSCPTSNHCLQVLFKVRDVLQSQLSKAPDGAHADNFGDFGNKSVSDVLREALETVDKAIQDSYLIWSIPLVLDPRYKLKRCIQKKFEEAFGSETKKYVCEIRGKIKELYTSYIKDGDDVKDGDDIEDSDGSIEEMSVDSTIPLDQELDEQCGSSHAEMTELDCYLQDSPARQTEGFDILNWWKVHGSVQYPTVARMARDALAMPTCSKLTTDQIAHVKSMLRGYGMHNHQDNGKLMRMRQHVCKLAYNFKANFV